MNGPQRSRGCAPPWGESPTRTSALLTMNCGYRARKRLPAMPSMPARETSPMPGDARWRVVPVEPTPDMYKLGAEATDWRRQNRAQNCYAAMLVAAPNAAEDEALVERLAEKASAAISSAAWRGHAEFRGSSRTRQIGRPQA